MTYGVGIDLGSTFAAAAVAVDGRLDMVQLGDPEPVAPSVVYVDVQARVLVGDVADHLSRRHPERAVRDFKRRLGDPTPIIVGGALRSPAALMADQLRAVLDTVSDRQGGPPDQVMLTYPAVWGPYRVEQFAAVSQLAGLGSPVAVRGIGSRPQWRSGDPPGMISEPVAAAVSHSIRHPLPPDGVLAVYDLGGGTFDSAVVRNGPDGLDLLGTPEGVEWLGGADFDLAILDHVDRGVHGAVSELDPAEPGNAAILARLRHDCALIKERLSSHPQASLAVALPNGVHQVTVRRTDFESMIRPALETTIEAVRRTLASAGIGPDDVASVLLVGGSSRIPLVSSLVREALGRPVVVDACPKHAVALGAAHLCAITAVRPAASCVMPPPLAAARPAPRPSPRPVLPRRPEVLPEPVRSSSAAATSRTRLIGSWSSKVVALVAIMLVLVGATGDSTPNLVGDATATNPTSVLAVGDATTELSRPLNTLLLSGGHPVRTSSSSPTGEGPQAAVDGDPGTSWVSTGPGPQWLQVDLGNVVAISDVALVWTNSNNRSFRLQLSDDAKHWADVYAPYSPGSFMVPGSESVTVSIGGSGRYLRYYVASTTVSISLSELQVMGRPVVEPGMCGNVDQASRHAVLTSAGQRSGGSTHGTAARSSGVVRVPAAHRRTGRPGDPQWLQVDLGASLPVCRITLTWGKDTPNDYRVEASADGRSWHGIAEGNSAAAGVDVLDIDVAGRYLRISAAAGDKTFLGSLNRLAVNVART